MITAKPIEPLSHEQTIDYGLPNIIEYSPRQLGFVNSNVEEASDASRVQIEQLPAEQIIDHAPPDVVHYSPGQGGYISSEEEEQYGLP